MPGRVKVSVIQFVDLPTKATGGKYVSIKASIGNTKFQTDPSEADENKAALWNSGFEFPVLNLQDNLIIQLLDSKDNTISQIEIGILTILEKGCMDELFPLKGGGHINLRINFVLTLEEHMRIEALRQAARKKIEHKSLKIYSSIPAEVNKKSISQTLRKYSKSKDDRGSHDEKKRLIIAIVVPEPSLIPNEVTDKTECIQEAFALLSPIDSQAPHKKALKYGVKKSRIKFFAMKKLFICFAGSPVNN
ncbi:hypothetical protein SUGI_0012210 [Cryptomeria japonica]|uniref:uncharacterized protein LOC131041973 n=1 Tax=Cryptomeria japonica TaxID=3369 RepID=UPI002408A4C0|nr:uncharacterized protein LOC131041973 [Cryptomeria japonica]GLJ05152.1 hypothetical protein SUGI_0012210 [Cryptomeria japonica]